MNKYCIFVIQTNKDMTNLTQYSDQLAGIAAYAKRINFDAKTGNIDDLMAGWINAGRVMNMYIEDNKEDVFRLIKQMVS